jgi:hypothetical protein
MKVSLSVSVTVRPLRRRASAVCATPGAAFWIALRILATAWVFFLRRARRVVGRSLLVDIRLAALAFHVLFLQEQ